MKSIAKIMIEMKQSWNLSQDGAINVLDVVHWDILYPISPVSFVEHKYADRQYAADK